MIWRPIQIAYAPHVATLLPLVQGDASDEANINHYLNPESTPLYFPSSLPLDIRERPELKEVREAERRLREPQADDALADVRHLRQIIQGFWEFKKLNVSGTGNRPNTRMLDNYSRMQYKLQYSVNRYRVAYNALMALDPNGSWRERLKELKDGDVRGPGRDVDNIEDTKTSKGRFEMSWIWLVPRSSQEMGNNQTEDEFNHSMRAEWAQTRARMCRWKEELQIIQEEMRRVLAFFEWRSSWWLEQGNRRQCLEPSLQSGVGAYAHKQACLCLRMAARCATYWLPIMKKHGITPTWSSKYKVCSKNSTRGASTSEDSEHDDDAELDEDDNRSDTGDLDINDIVDFD